MPATDFRHDSQGPDMWQLKTASYLAGHREVWRRGILFLLFFFDVLVLCVLVYLYISYAASIPRHRALEDSLSTTYVDFAGYRAAHRTLPLEMTELALVSVSAGKGDYVAMLKNSNRVWAAEAHYQFVNGNVRTPWQTTWLMPGDTRTVATFRHTADAAASVQFVWGGIAWRRVDPVRAPRLVGGLAADGFQYLPLKDGATGLDFIAHNKTPYSFWAIPATVVARDAGRIVGVHYVIVKEWKSGEARKLSLAWPESLPRVEETHVDFAVRALDPSSFMTPEGTAAPYLGF